MKNKWTLNSKVLQSYLVTALWSSTGEDENPLDDDYDIRDFSKEDLYRAKRDLINFFNMAEELLDKEKEQGITEGRIAHDFWLTRNGHGAGFWDGDYENGDELTEIAGKFKGIDIYVGDDNKIYFM